MLKSLLLGINGSRWSTEACEVGLNWAAQRRIPVTCLGVVDLSALAPAESMPVGASHFKASRDARVIAEGRDEIREALRRAADRAKQRQVECHVLLREGSAATLLGQEAQRHDLLILGRRGVPSTDRDPAASETLAEVLRHTPRPVVVACQQVPESCDVVIAYDGSAQAARTLQAFVLSDLSAGHPLHLVGIGDDSVAMHEILGRAVDFLQAHALRAETHVLPVGSGVAHTLLDVVRQTTAGLVVMGIYGQPWYRDLLLGSVTTKVLAQAPVPLFVSH